MLKRAGVDQQSLRDMLPTVPYFAMLSDHVLDDIARHTVLRQVEAGTQLFLRGEGHAEAPFFLVVEGAVRVYLTSLRGREQVLRLFHAGDTFAEVPLFDGGAYPASADAFTDVTLAVLPRRHMLRLMHDHPELAVGVVKVMAERLRHFNALVEDLSLHRVLSRVAHLLITEQADELNQTQMATMVGSSREMVNRSLHALEDDSVIAIGDDGEILILNPDRLNQIATEG